MDEDTPQTGETPVLLIDLADAADATLGQGVGHSEDKRRAYN
jgi:hypothetical protein